MDGSEWKRQFRGTASCKHIPCLHLYSRLTEGTQKPNRRSKAARAKRVLKRTPSRTGHSNFCGNHVRPNRIEKNSVNPTFIIDQREE
jgi:hypothetical protein